MAIANLEIIRIGAKNQAVNSDSLYDAFYKIKNNFDNINNATVYTNYVAGTGIGLSSNISNSTLTITNTGVTSLIAGSGISLSSGNGAVTISSNIGNSAITSVNISSNTLLVTNSSSGNTANYAINLPNTGVSAGSYTITNLTVDQYGRITAIANGTVASSSGISNGSSNVSIPVASGNIVLSVGGVPNVLGITNTSVISNANVNVQGTVNAFSVTANTANVGDDVNLGNTQLSWSTVTTVSTALRSIVDIPYASTSTGVKFLVKGHDIAGGRYSVHSVVAVTNGVSANYVVYGNAFIGTSPGSISVGVSSGNLQLRVTPTSTNSTVWTTQYQVI